MVLEPQRSGAAYYLLTAYYLNKEYGIKEKTSGCILNARLGLSGHKPSLETSGLLY
jgi:hypothetical protein